MKQVSELELRKDVRERYARLAIEGTASCGCVSDESCCATSDVPREASSVNAGCGSPLDLIKPNEGDVVIDLGSGGGIDVFRASPLVGEMGKAIGVDSTPEMVWRARKTSKSNNYTNVEFRLGEIENLPVDSGSVDLVISNCVINLSPDKEKVLNESFRVLKPGGKIAIADITIEEKIPESVLSNLDSWSGCVSGAISTSKYRTLLSSAGFDQIQIESVASNCDCCHDQQYPFGISNTHIRALKAYGKKGESV